MPTQCHSVFEGGWEKEKRTDLTNMKSIVVILLLISGMESAPPENKLLKFDIWSEGPRGDDVVYKDVPKLHEREPTPVPKMSSVTAETSEGTLFYGEEGKRKESNKEDDRSWIYYVYGGAAIIQIILIWAIVYTFWNKFLKGRFEEMNVRRVRRNRNEQSDAMASIASNLVRLDGAEVVPGIFLPGCTIYQLTPKHKLVKLPNGKAVWIICAAETGIDKMNRFNLQDHNGEIRHHSQIIDMLTSPAEYKDEYWHSTPDETPKERRWTFSAGAGQRKLERPKSIRRAVSPPPTYNEACREGKAENVGDDHEEFGLI